MESLSSIASRFEPASDGWFQIAQSGETPQVHGGECIVQVIDNQAMRSMVGLFDPQSPDARIDFDHFSHDPAKSSEAAGWIEALEIRGGELYAKPRWSSSGASALSEGRFRFVSPCFDPTLLDELGTRGEARLVRPLKLATAGLTNAPNMQRIPPLTNRMVFASIRAVPNYRGTQQYAVVIGNRAASLRGKFPSMSLLASFALAMREVEQS